uniref:Solute carrier family 13 member 2 n=1 Tax=Homo sapiens TaxID=9606 RepID=J3QR70_HUMAN
MALFWCTEALPLAVTALFPLILFPMMGIVDASEIIQRPFPSSFESPGECQSVGMLPSSILRTPTSCSSGGCWWPSRWNTGTCINASPSVSSSSLGCGLPR